MSPDARTAIPALERALRDDDESVRKAAALGNIGPGAKEAVPALERALKDSDKEVREAAAKALAKIKEPAARSQEPGKEQTP